MSDRRVNIKPALWGPMTWKMLHVISESMPETLTVDEQADVTKFFRSLTTVLPCQKCREHLAVLYDTGYFPQVDTKHHIKQAVFKLHNKVSKDLGKPILEKLPDLNTLLRSTTDDDVTQPSNGGSVLWLFVAAILILFVVYVLLRQNLS
jgi:hypothetical protein